MTDFNHKAYPLWSQFIDRKKEWIGGKLIETDMGHTAETKIKDIRMELIETYIIPSVMFIVEGEDFTCSFNVKYGGIIPDKNAVKEKYINLGTAYGTFKIYQKGDKP